MNIIRMSTKTNIKTASFSRICPIISTKAATFIDGRIPQVIEDLDPEKQRRRYLPIDGDAAHGGRAREGRPRRC